MKPTKCLLLIVIATIGLAGAAYADTDYFTSTAWKLSATNNVSLVANENGLSLDIQHKSKEPITICPVAPVILPSGARRLTLAANPAVMGSAAAWKSRTPAIVATLVDSRGETYTFAFSQGCLNNRGWGELSTEDLALSPSSNMVEIKWPQAPLTLVSIQIKPGWRGVTHVMLQGLHADMQSLNVASRPCQIVRLADPQDRMAYFEHTAVDIGYSAYGWQGAPAIDLDSIFEKPGDYTLGMRLRSSWQGPVVREWRQSVTMMPEDGAKRQKLSIDVPGPGTFFLDARIWNASGALQDIKRFVVIAPNPPADPAPPSASGAYLTLSPNAPDGVFSHNDTPSFTISVATLPGQKSVHIVLSDYKFNVLKDEVRPIDTPSKTIVSFPAASSGACRANVELNVDGKVVDRDSLLLGRKGQPPIVTRADLESHNVDYSLFRGITSSSVVISEVSPPGLEMLERITRGLDQMKINGNRVVEFEAAWRDLEPLPGVYQFEFLDKVIDLARARGIKAVIDPPLLSGQLPHWLIAHTACYEDGVSSLIEGSQYYCSPSDPGVQQAMQGLWKAIAQRYASNPNVVGYMPQGPATDLGYWGNGFLHSTDYSETAISSFQSYLREYKGYSLAQIDKRYGRQYASWSDVLPIDTKWDTKYDLRPIWIDWCAYKQWELHGWLERNFQAIREFDTRNAIFQYNWVSWGPEDYYYPLFKKYQVAPTTGGTGGREYIHFMSLYHAWGLPSRGGESIMNVDKWEMYASLFNMLAYGAAGAYYEVQWGPYFPEAWDTDPNGAKNLADWAALPGGEWLNRVHNINFSPEFALCSKILQDMNNAEPDPIEASSMCSWTDNLYRWRWLLPYRLSGGELKAWTSTDHRLPLWVSDTTPPALYQKQKIMVADSDIQVMAQSTAANLRAYAQGGGCLVTFASTGKFTQESGQPDYGFLASLGITNPTPLPGKTALTCAVTTGPLAGQTLVFSSLYGVSAPPGAQVIASLPDGTPCVLRVPMQSGEVILFLGDLDWNRSSDVLGALCKYRNIARWCDASDPNILAYSLRQGDTRYALAYYKIDNYGKPLLDFIGKNPIKAKIKLFGLTAPTYNVVEMIDGRELGTFSAQQLQDGVDLDMLSGELKILKCVPVK